MFFKNFNKNIFLNILHLCYPADSVASCGACKCCRVHAPIMTLFRLSILSHYRHAICETNALRLAARIGSDWTR